MNGHGRRWHCWGVTAHLMLALAGCATPSVTFDPGDVQFTQDEWEFGGRRGARLTTDHFDIFTTDEDAELVAYLPRFLETTYLFYSSLLPPPADADLGDARMQTYLFGQRSEWGSFVKTRFPQRYPLYRQIPAGAFTEGTACVAYNIGRARTWALLAHEGFHQYVNAHFGEVLPAWLNEGLAAYCESVEFRRDRPHFAGQRNTFRLRHLRQAYASGAAMPLRRLLDEDAAHLVEEVGTPAASAYYAQAWALMAFLLHEGEGRFAAFLPAVAQDLNDNALRIRAQTARAAAPNPAETSFGQAVFRVYVTEDIEVVQRDFEKYVHRLCWES